MTPTSTDSGNEVNQNRGARRDDADEAMRYSLPMRWARYVTGALLAGCGPAATWSPPPPIPPAVPESEWATFGDEGASDVLPVWREKLAAVVPERRAQLLDVSPDGGGLLVATRFGASVEVHLVSHPRGARRQLTAGTGDVLGARFVGDERLVYWRDDAGDGVGALGSRSLTGSAPHPVVGPPGADAVVRLDDAALAVVDGAGGLHLVELGGTSRRIRTDVEGELVAFGPRGDEVLLRRAEDTVAVDVATGQARTFDGRGIGWKDAAAVLVHEGRVVTQVPGGSPEPWPGAPSAVLRGAVGPDDTLACVTEDGSLHVVTGGEARPITLPPGDVRELRFARATATLGLTWRGPDGSVDVFRVAPLAGAAERWTESERGAGRGQELRWEGGRGWLRLPPRPGPHPVVLLAGEIDDRAGAALIQVAGVAAVEIGDAAIAAVVAGLGNHPDIDSDRVAVWTDEGITVLARPGARLTFADGPRAALDRDGARWVFRAPRGERRYATPAARRDALAAAVAFAHEVLIGSSPRGAPPPSR